MDKMDQSEPLTDELVGLQAQNLYLLNYINKLEFLLQKARDKRKRETKKCDKQLKKIVKLTVPSKSNQSISL